MSGAGDEAEGSRGREVLRWSLCLAFVMLVHGAGALAMLSEPDRGDQSDSVPIVDMEFSLPPITEAPLRDIAPGIIEQVQTAAAPPPTEEKPETVTEAKPVTEVKEQAVAEAKVTEIKPVTPAADDPVPVPELPVLSDPEVTLATAVPPPTQAAEVAEEKPEEKVEEKTAPPMATAPETTAPSRASTRNASLVSWKSRLATHLQRFKRYPAEAQARGHRGTATVTFRIDRTGKVLSASLVRGSGHASLDEETLALVRRAQPLPRPPADVTGEDFTFTVPVRFSVR